MSARAWHDAARRYCMDRLAGLADEYGLLERAREQLVTQLAPDERREAFRAWAGFRWIEMLLRAIERREPGDLGAGDEPRRYLINLATWLPNRWFEDSDDDPDPVAVSGVERERGRFVEYLAGLGEDLASSGTLPRRRVIAPRERRSILAKISRRWREVEEPWYPERACQAQPAMHLQTTWFSELAPIDELRRELGYHRDVVIWELSEGTQRWDDDCRYPADYEVEPGLFWPGHHSETLWAPKSLEWLVYSHHEGGTYFVGDWLVEKVKELWPAWSDHLWTSYFYRQPVRGRPRSYWLRPPAA